MERLSLETLRKQGIIIIIIIIDVVITSSSECCMASVSVLKLCLVLWRSNVCRSGVWTHLSCPQVWEPSCPKAGPGLGPLVGSGPALLDQRQNILWNVVIGQLSLPALCMVSSGALWRILKNPSTLYKMSPLNPSFMLLQAHPYLPGFILGLCLLRLLWCRHRGPRARPRHHVLAQRKMGLHWGALRFLPVCPQESCSQSHLSMQLCSFFRSHQIVTTPSPGRVCVPRCSRDGDNMH